MQTITISRDDFLLKASKAVSNNRINKEMSEKDPMMGMCLMLQGIGLVREIAVDLFGEENAASEAATSK